MRSTLLVVAGLLIVLPVASGVHLYRGPAQGCTPAVGALTDAAPNGPLAATIRVMHNSFNDATTGLPLAVINVGQAITWTWNSEHCHSVRGAFYSGFHYPAPEPTTPPLLPNLVHYPVPTLTPTLSYTHTFTAAGLYAYECEHHSVIGMQGFVLVQ